MGKIVRAKAWANNEVAYVAWDIDGKIVGCLGFEVTRVYVDNTDHEIERVRCASWVAFDGQRNPHWLPQDTSVWPVQKLSWRDLTLRKKRYGMTRRPDRVRVRYEIRPVGDLQPGWPAVGANPHLQQMVVKRDAHGKPVIKDGKPVREKVRAYDGEERPLCYLDDPFVTNVIDVMKERGIFHSTFTNGILAAQWLRNVLYDDGVLKKNELLEKIENPDDPHRKYLAGDVLPLLTELLARPGTFYLALYELDDKQLEGLLLQRAADLHIILSNTGEDDNGAWDARNANARKRLIDANVDIQHRMFNNSKHIGHNKFVVHVPPNGPRSVFTGSTNWTSTGIAGQTNNALLVEHDDVAGAYLDYWHRMKADALPVPTPLSDGMSASRQGLALRTSNQTVVRVPLTATSNVDIWFSPNRPEREKPKATPTKPTPVPPDLAAVYSRMRKANEAILFLAFYPSQQGKDSFIGEAIDIGLKDPSLLVTGAVSSAQAMPNYVPKHTDANGDEIEGDSPTTFDSPAGNVSLVRASRIDDATLCGDLGVEQLTAKGGIGAIIHDKLVVIDPQSPTDCTVILGSHNLGFKASYSNDENMLIITGNQALAMAYAVHILDVYDHYRFRAIEQQRYADHKPQWSGFLETHDNWQTGYVAKLKGALSRYMSRP